jgi:hypothetical protein
MANKLPITSTSDSAPALDQRPHAGRQALGGLPPAIVRQAGQVVRQQHAGDGQVERLPHALPDVLVHPHRVAEQSFQDDLKGQPAHFGADVAPLAGRPALQQRRRQARHIGVVGLDVLPVEVGGQQPPVPPVPLAVRAEHVHRDRLQRLPPGRGPPGRGLLAQPLAHRVEHVSLRLHGARQVRAVDQDDAGAAPRRKTDPAALGQRRHRAVTLESPVHEPDRIPKELQQIAERAKHSGRRGAGHRQAGGM